MIITEIGGTVGDIESLPFLEAARQVRQDVGRDNVFFVHVSLVPYLAPSGELKTKPTQHSVAALRSIGIQPDAIVCRADRDDPGGRQAQDRADVRRRRGGRGHRGRRPEHLRHPQGAAPRGLDAYVVRRLGLSFRDVNWTDWDELLRRVHRPGHPVEIALVGKYVDLPDAYLSVTEALRAGGVRPGRPGELRWVASDTCETPEGARRMLSGVDAVCIPGGFGVRGIEGKVGALRWARENQVSRRWGCASACSAWSSSSRATWRVSAAPAAPSSTPTRRTPSSPPWRSRRHIVAGDGDLGRHDAARGVPGGARRGLDRPRGVRPRARRGAAPAPVRGEQRLPARSWRRPGWWSPASRPDRSLVEFVELPREVHPYYVGTQAHPEFKSRPDRAHPLFAGLVGAALARQAGERLLEVDALPAPAVEPAAASPTRRGERGRRVSGGGGAPSGTSSRPGRSSSARSSTAAWSGTSSATPSTSARAASSGGSTCGTPVPSASSPWTRTTGCCFVRAVPAPGRDDLVGAAGGAARRRGASRPLRAARRELAEEADLRAGRWDVLIDWFNSPGGMTRGAAALPRP